MLRCVNPTLLASFLVVVLLIQLTRPKHAMQFWPGFPPKSEASGQPSGLLEVTVSVRWIPLVPAAYGT
jgi:hypothetical protein